MSPEIIAKLIIAYGIPGAIKIVETLTKENFTPADLQGLRDLVRLPSEYLKS